MFHPQNGITLRGYCSSGKHYHCARIARRHWLSMAQKVDFPAVQMIASVDEGREITPQAIEQTMSRIPNDFSETVVMPIIEGVSKAVAQK